MKPIKFKEQNVVYAKDQPEYQQLPAFKSEEVEGHVITCWKLSFIERLRILFIGELWISLMTFNKPLTPLLPTTKKSDVLITQGGNEWNWRTLISVRKYIVTYGIFEGYEFDGEEVIINEETRIQDLCSEGRSYPIENCKIVNEIDHGN